MVKAGRTFVPFPAYIEALFMIVCFEILKESDFRMSFAELCADENIIFIDMTEEFVSLYEEQHILAHGFVNTTVGRGHLNRYGHASIAKRLAEVIEEGNDGN